MKPKRSLIHFWDSSSEAHSSSNWRREVPRKLSTSHRDSSGLSTWPMSPSSWKVARVGSLRGRSEPTTQAHTSNLRLSACTLKFGTVKASTWTSFYRTTRFHSVTSWMVQCSTLSNVTPTTTRCSQASFSAPSIWKLISLRFGTTTLSSWTGRPHLLRMLRSQCPSVLI